MKKPVFSEEAPLSSVLFEVDRLLSGLEIRDVEGELVSPEEAHAIIGITFGCRWYDCLVEFCEFRMSPQEYYDRMAEMIAEYAEERGRKRLQKTLRLMRSA